MSRDLLVVAGMLGLLASGAGAAAPAKLRAALTVALTVAACACGFAAAAEVLHTGHTAVVESTRLMPLSSFSLGLDPLGALFVAVAAVVGACVMIFRLGYAGHGLSSRTASSALPLFVTTLLLVPAASNVTSFLYLWELMALTSLVLVL
ncbi:MAG: hydrogenase 4 subunit B, partial [Acidimicrobiales bacterium]